MKLFFMCLKRLSRRVAPESQPIIGMPEDVLMSVCRLPDLSQFLSSHWAANEFIDITLAHGSTDLNINGKKEKQKVMYVCMLWIFFTFVSLSKLCTMVL